MEVFLFWYKTGKFWALNIKTISFIETLVRMEIMNQWLAALVVSIAVFLLLLKGNELRKSILPALIAVIGMAIGSLVGSAAGLLIFKGVNLPFPDWLNLYAFTIDFLMAVIFVQYLPKTGYLQGVYALGWGTLFFIFRAYIGINFGMFEMVRYNQLLLFQTTTQYMFALAALKVLLDKASKEGKKYA